MRSMAPPAQIFTDPTRRLGEKKRVIFIDVTDVYQKILGVYMGLYDFIWIYMDLYGFIVHQKMEEWDFNSKLEDKII